VNWSYQFEGNMLSVCMPYVPVRLSACCQDAGGTDQLLDPFLLRFVSYLCPNELELQALTGSTTQTQGEVGKHSRSCKTALQEGSSLLLAAPITQPALGSRIHCVMVVHRGGPTTWQLHCSVG
jgi:hypothetical protein